MLNMKDNEKHRQSNYMTKNHTSLQDPAIKRHMKTIHVDQLSKPSGHSGVVMTDTKQQIFSKTYIKYLHN